MNFDELVGQLNDPRLKKSVRSLADSRKGKELLKKLDKIDKRKLEQYVKSINGNSISSEMLLRQINNNPQLLDKLNSLLSKM